MILETPPLTKGWASKGNEKALAPILSHGKRRDYFLSSPIALAPALTPTLLQQGEGLVAHFDGRL